MPSTRLPCNASGYVVIALWRARCVYIVPMAALAKERYEDWSKKFGSQLGLNVTQLVGETQASTAAAAHVSHTAMTEHTLPMQPQPLPAWQDLPMSASLGRLAGLQA